MNWIRFKTTVSIDTDVTKTAFCIMLNNKLLGNDVSKILLDEAYEANFKISLFEIKNADYEIRKYIFTNYFVEDDIQKIINHGIEFDLWDEFILRINNSAQFLERILDKDLSKDFIDHFMKDSNLKEENKINLLTKVVKNKTHVEHWERWMKDSSSEDLQLLAMIFENKKRPEYPISRKIQPLVDALVRRGIISKAENNQLRFKSTEFKKLLES